MHRWYNVPVPEKNNYAKWLVFYNGMCINHRCDVLLGIWLDNFPQILNLHTISVLRTTSTYSWLDTGIAAYLEECADCNNSGACIWTLWSSSFKSSLIMCVSLCVHLCPQCAFHTSRSTCNLQGLINPKLTQWLCKLVWWPYRLLTSVTSGMPYGKLTLAEFEKSWKSWS